MLMYTILLISCGYYLCVVCICTCRCAVMHVCTYTSRHTPLCFTHCSSSTAEALPRILLWSDWLSTEWQHASCLPIIMSSIWPTVVSNLVSARLDLYLNWRDKNVTSNKTRRILDILYSAQHRNQHRHICLNDHHDPHCEKPDKMYACQRATVWHFSCLIA